MTGDPIARLRAADPLAGELPPALERMPELAARRRGLIVANALLLLAVTAHGVDHAFQQGGYQRLSAEVFGGGVVMGIVTVASLLLAIHAHRRAPLVTTAGGGWIAVAVVTGHFLPHWSEFSDSYPDLGVGLISYVAAGSVVAAGLAAVAVGASALRRPVDA